MAQNPAPNNVQTVQHRPIRSLLQNRHRVMMTSGLHEPARPRYSNVNDAIGVITNRTAPINDHTLFQEYELEVPPITAPQPLPAFWQPPWFQHWVETNVTWRHNLHNLIHANRHTPSLAFAQRHVMESPEMEELNRLRDFEYEPPAEPTVNFRRALDKYKEDLKHLRKHFDTMSPTSTGGDYQRLAYHHGKTLTHPVDILAYRFLTHPHRSRLFGQMDAWHDSFTNLERQLSSAVVERDTDRIRGNIASIRNLVARRRNTMARYVQREIDQNEWIPDYLEGDVEYNRPMDFLRKRHIPETSKRYLAIANDAERHLRHLTHVQPYPESINPGWHEME